MTTKHKTAFLLLLCLLCGLPAWADDYLPYSFDEEDWQLKNSTGTLKTEGVGNQLVITDAGSEVFNIAVKYNLSFNNKYGLAATQCYFTVVTDNSLDKDTEKCKLYCINGSETDDHNVQPDYVVTEGGQNIYVWDISKLEGFTLTEGVKLHAETAFALTSASGEATITDINFYTVTELTKRFPTMVSKNLPFLFDETSIANDIPGTEVSGANVKVVRKLKAGNWNTFCVPFGMSAEQLSDSGISEVRKLTSSEKNGENITLTFQEVSAVEAGVPYIVKVSSELSELNVSGVTVASASSLLTDVTTEHVVMTGNYQATTVPQGSYFISSDKFYLADTDKVSLKGFRAYVTLKPEGGAANVLAIDLYDGGETSAREVQRGGVRYVDVYNMSGVCLRTAVDAAHALDGLPAGEVYLIEGTKILKKR